MILEGPPNLQASDDRAKIAGYARSASPPTSSRETCTAPRSPTANHEKLLRERRGAFVLAQAVRDA